MLEGREVLDSSFAHYEERFLDLERIPVPDFWGGWQVLPYRIEFWQGRESRLHDRLVYVLHEDASWTIERLSP
ncbi:MAG: hypothetical protein GWP22_07945 [Actinomycetales bacterium]|nr:hypothetical protein [Actinomycetales bacterium]